VLWLTVLAFCLGTYVLHPEYFTAECIANFLDRFRGGLMVAYIVLHILRAFTLLPSTPLVIAGVLLFPGQPAGVLAMCVTGIVLSSVLIYYFSEFLGFDKYLERKSQKRMNYIRTKLNHPMATVFVAAWAFFPIVPTDLLSYAAGSVRMNFWRFIIGIFIGETLLCAIYVYAGAEFWGRII